MSTLVNEHKPSMLELVSDGRQHGNPGWPYLFYTIYVSNWSPHFCTDMANVRLGLIDRPCQSRRGDTHLFMLASSMP